MYNYEFNASETKEKLVCWIKDYFTDPENGAGEKTKAVVGISGGKDSSTVAALCVEALGKERVFGVLMPQGEQFDIDVSRDLCQTLGISYVEINIGKTVVELINAVKKSVSTELTTITTFNTPARIRMATLYAVAGSLEGGARVANTCNLSEDWVGYATKYGDAAGDFSPLSDLTVAEVKAVGKECGLADKFVEKTPIDGLCGKTDEENLGFTYAVLDKYIRTGQCDDITVKETIDSLHSKSVHKIAPMPAFRSGNSIYAAKYEQWNKIRNL